MSYQHLKAGASTISTDIPATSNAFSLTSAPALDKSCSNTLLIPSSTVSVELGAFLIRIFQFVILQTMLDMSLSMNLLMALIPVSSSSMSDSSTSIWSNSFIVEKPDSLAEHSVISIPSIEMLISSDIMLKTPGSSSSMLFIRASRRCTGLSASCALITSGLSVMSLSLHRPDMSSVSRLL